MSLGLPRFGAHPRRVAHPAVGAVRTLGFVALAYALVIAALEGRAAFLADRALERSRLEVARVKGEAEQLKGSMRKNPDTLVATASKTSGASSGDRDPSCNTRFKFNLRSRAMVVAFVSRYWSRNAAA